MRLRNIPGAKEAVGESPYVVHDPSAAKGKWDALFGSDHPIRIEIGMGKGRFLMDLAAANPQINYVGIERYDSVLLRAIQKMDALAQEGAPLPNVRFLCVDATELPEIFAPREVDRIYLNFSDPWPKDRHSKRRLGSRQFLERYLKFLKPGGEIEFKTDNMGLFDFCVKEVEPGGFTMVAMTRDLHHDPVMNQGNVMTEYEEKFSSLGNPIYKYIIRRKDT